MLQREALSLLCVLVAAVSAAPANSSSCFEQCFADRPIIRASNDLRNLRKIMDDSTKFCKLNEEVVDCYLNCNEDFFGKGPDYMMTSTAFCDYPMRTFACEAGTPDPVETCAAQCGWTQQDYPFRFDLHSDSAFNVSARADELGPICTKFVCIAQCTIRLLNDTCSGAEQMFKSLLTKQVQDGSTGIDAEDVTKLHESLPAECKFLADFDAFEQLFPSSASDVVPGTFSIDDELEGDVIDDSSSPHIVIHNNNNETSNFEDFASSEVFHDDSRSSQAPIESSEDETPEPPTWSVKERKPDEPLFLASRDTSRTERPQEHVFRPEDDFVPIGHPENISTSEIENVTENPAVAMVEEDVKLVNQPSSLFNAPVTKIQLNGDTESDDVTARMEIIEDDKKMEEATDDESKEEATTIKEHKTEDDVTEAMLVVDANEEDKNTVSKDEPEFNTQTPEMIHGNSAALTLAVSLLFASLLLLL